VQLLSCSTAAYRFLLSSSGLEGRPVFAPEATAEEAGPNGSRVLGKSTSVGVQGSAFTRTLQVQPCSCCLRASAHHP
jgi:hypothetical protein